eukprot:94925_1
MENNDAIETYLKYVKKFGYEPQQPNHLVTFSAKINKALSYKDAKNIINNPPNILNEKQKVHNDVNTEDEKKAYDEDVVNQLVTFGFGTYDECVIASKKTIDYWDINAVVNTINSMQIDKPQFSKCQFTIGDSCSVINQIIASLKYYSSLNILNKKKDRNKLVKYCTTANNPVLDNYIHLINIHNNDIEQIYNLVQNDRNMISCDGHNCLLLQRHHRNRHYDHIKIEAMKKETNDKHFIFYRDIMDALHCYVFHLYDVGLRVKLPTANMTKSLKHDNKNFDAKFANLCKVIDKKQVELQKIGGFEDDRFANHKFNVNANANIIQYEKDQTFMDSLFNFMFQGGVKVYELTKLKLMIDNEEYDSDAWMEDMEEDEDSWEYHSNFEKMLSQKYYLFKYMKQHYKNLKISRNSFSIGYIFYYWYLYKYTNVRREQ